MAIYPDRDISTSNDGDLVINERGDLEVGEATEAVSQLLKMVVATDLGEMDMLPDFGANLGTLIGKSMAEVVDRIPTLIRDGLRRAGYIENGDVYVDVYPIDVDKIMVFLDLKGTYINSLGEEVLQPSGSIKFFFPYTAERIREWT